jgi:ribonucleoside-diphosphate reductase beta chain
VTVAAARAAGTTYLLSRSGVTKGNGVTTFAELRPVESRFRLDPEIMAGPIYRKYEKATRKVWDAKQLDYEQDAADWRRMRELERAGIATITVRFEAGEQEVTDELLPMLAAAHALGRFDWVMFISTFMLEEARHSEFFTLWHAHVPGLLTPADKAAYWPAREHTVDPLGRFTVGEPVYEGLPRYGKQLSAAVESGNEPTIEGAFVQFATLYCAWVEGVLTMPSYEIVLDTTELWDVLPTLRRGFRNILGDEGRHITFGTHACRILIEKNREYEALAHGVIDEYRGNAVGMLEYQRGVPGLDLHKYQGQKARHYLNRCREMGVTADQSLVDQILDPEIDFVVGVEAG